MSPARVPLAPVRPCSPLAMRALICLNGLSFQHPPSSACSAKRNLIGSTPSRYLIGSTPICQSSGSASRKIGMGSVSSRYSSAPFSHMAPAGDMVTIFDLSFSCSSIPSSHDLIQSSNSIPLGFASVPCVR